MPIYGKIAVIKPTGAEGSYYPLSGQSCKFGTSETCDIRVYRPKVAEEHCQIDCEPDGRAFIINLNEKSVTKLNNIVVAGRTELKHGDVITIGDKQFRLDPPDLSSSRRSSSAVRLSQAGGSQKRRSRSASPNVSASKAKRRSSGNLNVSPFITEVPETPMAAVDKRKSVTFGSALSPELFDKKLPTATPIKKGAQPTRKSLGFHRKPLLKIKRRSLSTSPKRKSTSPGVKVLNKPPLPQSARKASPPTARQSRLPVKVGSKPPSKLAVAAKSLKTPPRPLATASTSRIPISFRSASAQKPPLSTKSATQTRLVSTAVKSQPSVSRLATPTVSTSAKKRMSITPKQPVKKVKSWASVVKVTRPDYTAKVKSPKLTKTPAPVAPKERMKIVNSPGVKRKVLDETKPQNPQLRTNKEQLGRLTTTTTGHVLSPETVVIHKSAVSRGASLKKSPLLKPTPINSPATLNEEYSLSTPADVSRMAVSPLDSPRLAGIRHLYDSPKLRQSAISPRLAGVKNLFAGPSTSKGPSTPRLAGVKEMLRTPADNKSVEVSLKGLRELVKTPKVQAEAILAGIRELVKTPIEGQSPLLRGVRELLRSPKTPTDAVLTGIRELLQEQKSPQSPQLDGLAELFKTPPGQHFTPNEPQSPIHAHLNRKTPRFESPVQQRKLQHLVDLGHNLNSQMESGAEGTSIPRSTRRTNAEPVGQPEKPQRTRSPRKPTAAPVEPPQMSTRTRSPRKAAHLAAVSPLKVQTRSKSPVKKVKATVETEPNAEESAESFNVGDICQRKSVKDFIRRSFYDPSLGAANGGDDVYPQVPDVPATSSSAAVKPRSTRTTRTAAKKPEVEVAAVSPVKRTRKGKVDAEPHEAEVSPVKRGRKTKIVAQPEEAEVVVVSPVKRGRRGNLPVEPEVLTNLRSTRGHKVVESPVKVSKRVVKSKEIFTPPAAVGKTPLKRRKVAEKTVSPVKAVSRKRKPTEVVEEEEEIRVKHPSPVKRGRKVAVAEETVSPVKKTRGRKAVANESPVKTKTLRKKKAEVIEDAQVKLPSPVKRGRKKVAVVEPIVSPVKATRGRKTVAKESPVKTKTPRKKKAEVIEAESTTTRPVAVVKPSPRQTRSRK